MNVFSGDKHSSFGRMRVPKNVTFRGVRRRSYENCSSSSDASDEEFSSEPNGDPGGHLGGGSCGGPSPATKPRPLERPGTGWRAGVALVAGPEPHLFRWRGRDRPYGGAPRHWTRLTSIIMEIGLSYREMWPNGLMDQDAIWYGGRPQPRPHCVT